MLPPTHPDLAATMKTYALLLTKRTPPSSDRAAEMQAQADEILTRHRQEDQ